MVTDLLLLGVKVIERVALPQNPNLERFSATIHPKIIPSCLNFAYRRLTVQGVDPTFLAISTKESAASF
jgi:hypothetical protein